MQFTKYSKLTNSCQGKAINAIKNLGLDKEIYVVTEKVHGANFGIHLNLKTEEVTFSRRSAFLKENETFYSHHRVSNFLERGIRKLKNISMMYFGEEGKVDVISVYGEIFGGNLDGKSVGGAKQVQSEVMYSPDTEFMAFDIALDGKYLPFYQTVGLLNYTGIPVVPVLEVTDNLMDALAVKNDNSTIIPSLLGYENLKGNIMEGTVIRLMKKEETLPNGKRLVLKNKNSKFNEKNNTKPVKIVEPLSTEAEETLKRFIPYLNDNRLNAVISKEEEPTQKQFGKFLGLLIKDAMEDYANDHQVLRTEVDKDEWERFLKEVNKEAVLIVRKFWTNNF